MRAVVQRVASATVVVGGRTIAEVSHGLVALVGVEKGDTDRESEWLASKLIGLRVFEDSEGKMNLSLADVGGALLLVPNFTVCGDVQKGRRPSFDAAAAFEEGKRLFNRVAEMCRRSGVDVKCGEYGAEMQVSLVNDGPVTLIIDTSR